MQQLTFWKSPYVRQSPPRPKPQLPQRPTVRQLQAAFPEGFPCGNAFCVKTGHLTCGGCGVVRYCSKGCQRKAWKRPLSRTGHADECFGQGYWVPLILGAEDDTVSCASGHVLEGAVTLLRWDRRPSLYPKLWYHAEDYPEERMELRVMQLTWSNLSRLLRETRRESLQDVVAALDARHVMPWSSTTTNWERFVAKWIVSNDGVWYPRTPSDLWREKPEYLQGWEVAVLASYCCGFDAQLSAIKRSREQLMSELRYIPEGIDGLRSMGARIALKKQWVFTVSLLSPPRPDVCDDLIARLRADGLRLAWISLCVALS